MMAEDSGTGFQPVAKHGQDVHDTGGTTGVPPVNGNHEQDAHETSKPRAVIVARNTVWNLVAKGVDFLGNLIATIMIARVLGVEGFGQFSFVVAFATLFSMGMDWGLDYILVREISRRTGDGRVEFAAVLGLKFLFLLALMPVLIVANSTLSMTKGVRTAIYLAAAGIMMIRVGFTRTAEGIFLVRDAVAQKALIIILYQVVRLIGVAYVLWSKGSLIMMFAVMLAADALQALVVGFWIHSRHLPISLRLPKQEISFFFSQALPLGITLCCIGIFYQQDTLILKHFTDDTQVGLFSSGYRIIVATVAFITPAFAVLLPELSRKASESLSGVSTLSSKVAHYFLAVTIPGVVVLALVAKTVMVILYGQSFAVAAPVLQFLSVVVFLGSLEFLFAMGLVSLSKPWWILIATGLGLVINVGLNLLWIPKWAFMGAVYAKLIAEIVTFCAYLMLFQLAVGGSMFPRWMLRPVAAGVVMVLVVLVSSPLGMIPSIVIGLGVYALSFFATGLLPVRTDH